MSSVRWNQRYSRPYFHSKVFSKDPTDWNCIYMMFLRMYEDADGYAVDSQRKTKEKTYINYILRLVTGTGSWGRTETAERIVLFTQLFSLFYDVCCFSFLALSNTFRRSTRSNSNPSESVSRPFLTFSCFYCLCFLRVKFRSKSEWNKREVN